MVVVARMIVVSLLTAGLGVVIGFALAGTNNDGEWIAFLLGCVGAIVGVIAGAVQEIVTALRQKPWS